MAVLGDLQFARGAFTDQAQRRTVDDRQLRANVCVCRRSSQRQYAACDVRSGGQHLEVLGGRPIVRVVRHLKHGRGAIGCRYREVHGLASIVFNHGLVTKTNFPGHDQFEDASLEFGT